MPVSLERIVMYPSVAQDKFIEPGFTPGGDVDLDIFGAKEVRDVLKSRAHCLKAGFPSNHIIIITLNEIRIHYILRVGLPTYLSQMLGELGKFPIQNCVLYDEYDRPLDVSCSDPNQSLQRFLAKQFRPKTLPFKVEGSREPQASHTEVRYL